MQMHLRNIDRSDSELVNTANKRKYTLKKL